MEGRSSGQERNPNWIRAYREALGLSQEQLAGEIGKSRNAVQSWESDGVPQERHLHELLNYFITHGVITEYEQAARFWRTGRRQHFPEPAGLRDRFAVSLGAPALPQGVSVTSSSPTCARRVFLCHASSDKGRVRPLYNRLRADGFDPWLDEEDLVPGQDWARQIPRAVRAADVVLVCLSKQSVTKAGFVQREIRVALDVAEERPEDTIYIIPARLEECDVPERLRQWQWVDLFVERGYERLMRALQFVSRQHR